MTLLSARDIRSALVTGLTTGAIAWRIMVFLGAVLPFELQAFWLVPLVPMLWLAGVQLGYALAGLWSPFAQFGRFVAIGFANAAVDFGVLYLAIGLTGLAEGTAYAAFKGVSFTIASVHSYLWNKFWAFEAGRSGGGGTEALRFLGVSLFAVAVNVTIATTVVAARPAAFEPAVWAGVGAVAGSALALIFSFTGFRLFVFGKKG